MKHVFESPIYKKIHIVLFCFIISLLIIFRELYGFNINKYIFLILIIAFLLTASNKCIFISYTLFLLPLYSGLPNNLITISTVLIYFIKYHKTISFPHITSILLIILLVYELFHFMIEPFTLYLYAIDCSYILLFFLIITQANDLVKGKNLIIRMFSIGLIISCTIIFIKTLEMYSLEQILNYGMRLGMGLEEEVNDISLTWNPNSLAVFCIVSVGLIFTLKKKKIVDFIDVAILLFYGSLTISKNFVVSLVILLVLTLCISKLKYKFSYMVLILIIIGSIYLFVPQTIDNFINRFLVDDITTNRNVINTAYFEKWYQSLSTLLFGSGIQSYQLKYEMIDSVHNATLELFICWGIIGFIIFVLAILSSLKIFKNNIYINKQGIVTLLTFLASIQAMRLITAPELLLILGIIISVGLYDYDSKLMKSRVGHIVK